MTQRNSLRQISPSISKLLGRVRRRIRKIVLGEGIAISLAVLLFAFWVALALDYLPVKFGYSEASVWGRLTLLLVSLGVFGWLIYKLVFSRFFVRLEDSSMAILVERKYETFDESLLTTVGSVNPESSFGAESTPITDSLANATRLRAESLVHDVDVANVVNGKSLRNASWITGALLCSVALLAFAQPSMASLAFKRLYLLQDDKWPRQTNLEFLGATVERDSIIESIPELTSVLQPIDGVITVAAGSSLTMTVAANESTSGDEPRSLQIPETCWLNYRSLDGSSGSTPFRRIGAPRNGQQIYSLQGPPLENLLGDTSFDVSGGDDRTSRFDIRVVEKPVVEKTQLAISYPKYMVDESNASFVDQVIDWTGQKAVPIGTRLKIFGQSTSELSKVYYRVRIPNEEQSAEDSASQMQLLSATGQQFELQLPPLYEDTTVEFFLCDTFGVVNEQPHIITIEAIEDEAPEIDVRLAGIGNAVTPDVQIPLNIEIQDDYGVGRAWVEIEIGDALPFEEPLNTNEARIDRTIDFRERRESVGEQFRLPATGQKQLSLVVAASDRFDLDGAEPNVGRGDRYDLKIVSADELLRILEQAEVGQRRRLEQIIREMNELRDYLVRAKPKRADGSLETEPGDRETTTEPGDEASPKRDELQRLFAQRAILQNDKSMRELLACVSAFQGFRLQLINNRVSADARLERFENQVIEPLNLTVNSQMTELSQQLDRLEEALRAIETAATDAENDTGGARNQAGQLASDAIERTDAILVRLNTVLNLLIKHETQNELLDIVRQMIAKQKELREKTRKQRQKKAFEGLLD